MNNYSWDYIRSFLAVAQLGSLSAAARSLGISQPTMSRDIQALESGMQVNLFIRSPQGLALTESGQALVDAAKQMGTFAEAFGRQAAGFSETLEGDIRISANEPVGIYLLPAAIASFQSRHPGVRVETVISNRASSLYKREADIALRMFRPGQPELVARRLPDMPLGFYAHRDYLEAHGTPQQLSDLQQHCMIGFDQGTEFIDGAAAMGIALKRDDFHQRTDSMIMQIQLARQGCGIVITHAGLARQWPELQRILESCPLPALQFWVVCHADTQFNARIRAFRKHLIEWFGDDPYRDLAVPPKG